MIGMNARESHERTAAALPQPIAGSRQARKFRSDIQGLRAVAVLLVVAYHAGVPQLSGGFIGVDVFFVISGFLITMHLVQGIDAGTMRFGAFYARRIRRLMPASLAVLALSLTAGLLWAPPLDRSSLLLDAAATAAYVPNLLFAWQGTDYLAGSAPSLFQHYWSLGVEEQFYLLWPVLIVAAMWALKGSRRGLALLLIAFTLASFALGIWATDWRPSWAFFLLPARAWEFGLGGLVGLGVMHLPRLSRPSASMTGLAWVGVGGLVLAAFAFTSATPYPSWNAAVPAVATALVILGGTGAAKSGPGRLLSLAPMQFIGKISYSLYLVHWPLLVLPQAAVGWGQPLPLWLTLLLGLASIPLAWLSWRYIEEPGRSRSAWWGVSSRRAVGAAALAAALIVITAIPASLLVRQLPITSTRVAEPLAATSNPSGTNFVPSNLTPALQATHDDFAEVYSNGCHLDVEATSPAHCSVGENSEAPRVVLFGDSHAATWFPPLADLAESGEITLEVHTKSSCPSAQVVSRLPSGAPYGACDEWRANVLEELALRPPQVVVIANYIGTHSPSTPSWDVGLAGTVDSLPTGTRAIVVEDVPTHPADPATCLSQHTEDALACAPLASDAIDASANQLDRSGAAAAGAYYMPVNQFLCSERCPPIIGSTMFYRDEHHLTETASQIFTSHFAATITAVLDG